MVITYQIGSLEPKLKVKFRIKLIVNRTNPQLVLFIMKAFIIAISVTVVVTATKASPIITYS